MQQRFRRDTIYGVRVTRFAVTDAMNGVPTVRDRHCAWSCVFVSDYPGSTAFSSCPASFGKVDAAFVIRKALGSMRSIA